MPSNIIHKRTRKKNPPIPHRADGPRPIEQFESLWDEARGSALFRGAFARATRRGWWTNSCFLMCRDGARAAKRGKKKKRARRQVGEGGEERSNNRNHVGQRPWPARRSSQIVVVVVVSMSLAPQPWLSFPSWTMPVYFFFPEFRGKKTGNLMVVKVSIRNRTKRGWKWKKWSGEKEGFFAVVISFLVGGRREKGGGWRDLLLMIIGLLEIGERGRKEGREGGKVKSRDRNCIKR